MEKFAGSEQPWKGVNTVMSEQDDADMRDIKFEDLELVPQLFPDEEKAWHLNHHGKGPAEQRRRGGECYLCTFIVEALVPCWTAMGGDGTLQDFIDHTDYEHFARLNDTRMALMAKYDQEPEDRPDWKTRALLACATVVLAASTECGRHATLGAMECFLTAYAEVLVKTERGQHFTSGLHLHPEPRETPEESEVLRHAMAKAIQDVLSGKSHPLDN